MTECLDKILQQPCHGGVGVGVGAAHASDESPLQVNALRKRTRSVNGSSHSQVDTEAAIKDGTHFVDALDQNFKSHQEIARDGAARGHAGGVRAALGRMPPSHAVGLAGA